MTVYHSECGTEMDVVVETHNSAPGGGVTGVRYVCERCGETWVGERP